MTPGENTQTTSYRFRECRDCRKDGKGNCLEDGKIYESTHIAYATQIFSTLFQFIKETESFFLKLTDWNCREGGKTMTFNLCIRSRKDNNDKGLHSIPLKFGGDDVPLSCQHYNISVFLAELLSLLRGHGYLSEITTEQEISISRLHTGLVFKFI